MPHAPDWIGPLMTMHAYSAVNWLAMHCRRHMDLYGTMKEQLGGGGPIAGCMLLTS